MDFSLGISAMVAGLMSVLSVNVLVFHLCMAARASYPFTTHSVFGNKKGTTDCAIYGVIFLTMEGALSRSHSQQLWAVTDIKSPYRTLRTAQFTQRSIKRRHSFLEKTGIQTKKAPRYSGPSCRCFGISLRDSQTAGDLVFEFEPLLAHLQHMIVVCRLYVCFRTMYCTV